MTAPAIKMNDSQRADIIERFGKLLRKQGPDYSAANDSIADRAEITIDAGNNVNIGFDSEPRGVAATIALLKSLNQVGLIDHKEENIDKKIADLKATLKKEELVDNRKKVNIGFNVTIKETKAGSRSVHIRLNQDVNQIRKRLHYAYEHHGKQYNEDLASEPEALNTTIKVAAKDMGAVTTPVLATGSYITSARNYGSAKIGYTHKIKAYMNTVIYDLHNCRKAPNRRMQAAVDYERLDEFHFSNYAVSFSTRSYEEMNAADAVIAKLKRTFDHPGLNMHEEPKTETSAKLHISGELKYFMEAMVANDNEYFQNVMRRYETKMGLRLNS